MMTTVAICDDHEMVREALSDVIGHEDGIEIVGSAATIDDAVELIDNARPDVLVVDVRLKDENGLDLARKVRADYPDTKVIVLTSFDSDTSLVEAYEMGASAFMLKTGSADALVRAIRDAAAGLRLINPAEVRSAAAALDKKGVPIIRGLDANDRHIARLIAQGYSDKQIAETVYLGLQTVRNRVSRLLSRFDKENRTQLALFFSDYLSEISDD